MKTAAQMVANWQKGMQNPATVQKYKDGINGTQVNPMALAASATAQQKYLNNTSSAVSSGRMAAKLNSVPMEFWKSQAVNIGANNLTMGANKGLSKATAFFNRFAAVYQQASDAAKAIPNDGSEAAISARVLAAIRVMKQAAGKQ